MGVTKLLASYLYIHWYSIPFWLITPFLDPLFRTAYFHQNDGKRKRHLASIIEACVPGGVGVCVHGDYGYAINSLKVLNHLRDEMNSRLWIVHTGDVQEEPAGVGDAPFHDFPFENCGGDDYCNRTVLRTEV